MRTSKGDLALDRRRNKPRWCTPRSRSPPRKPH